MLEPETAEVPQMNGPSLSDSPGSAETQGVCEKKKERISEAVGDVDEKQINDVNHSMEDVSIISSRELDQFTEPEVLDLAVLEEEDENSDNEEEEDSNSNEDDKDSMPLTGRSYIEDLNNTSSDTECSNKEKKPKRRRKKRPKVEWTPEMAARREKMHKIKDVLVTDPLDLETLRELSVTDKGLVTDELRRKAWPRLMGLEHMECTPKPLEDEVKKHKDYSQVVLDVNRSLKRFPPGIADEYRVVLMEQLTTLIIRVLMKHPELHYYQGYHDVAITFLLVVGEDVGFELVERLSVTHLQEFMEVNMERTTYYLTYIYPILKRANPKLCQFMLDSGVGTIFCLPWLITWYAHTLSDYRNVVRLYDFFLASPRLMPMYIAAAIVMHREKEVLAGECDMAMQHFILSQVPDSLPFEQILVKARELYDHHPPTTLTKEVDELIQKKAKMEEVERKQAEERRKKYQLKKGGKGKVIPLKAIEAAFTQYLRLSPGQQKVVKVVVFAFTATVATTIYNYYSQSSSLFPYRFWNW
ncbi:TBC1 domain family member 20 [Oratosquilla oratoria]|uniref:TBC1 domain family member 20 n=1 Tax=Oratosquilla oratoria TaxID=337810 RepID=UPI003F772D16